MANSRDKPLRYERTRMALVLPGIPLPAKELVSRDTRPNVKNLGMQGITTQVTSVNRAKREANVQLGKCRGRVRRGDLRAVLELLDLNPAFIQHPWVRKTYERLLRIERPGRKRGRPKGRYTINPEIVWGFVMALRASGRAKNDHREVVLLGRMGIFSYDQGRRLCNQAKSDPRLRALLLPSPYNSPTETDKRFAQLLRKAITPSPGQTLTYELCTDGVARLVKADPQTD
jgi:hypothetical protein